MFAVDQKVEVFDSKRKTWLKAQVTGVKHNVTLQDGRVIETVYYVEGLDDVRLFGGRWEAQYVRERTEQ